MQYCSAAPVAKYIPYTESVLSHCGTGSHRYCELFVALASPEQQCPLVDGIKLPPWLEYSPNHMWLDRGTDGSCHIGLDAFLTRTLGHVEKLSFVSSRSPERPSVVLTAGGVDLHMSFPGRFLTREANTYLRTNPDRIIANPYTLGWLFEGTAQAATPPGRAAATFKGEPAVAWMKQEIRDLGEFVSGSTSTHHPPLGALMTDGGTVVEGLVRHLTREEILALFNNFFSH